MKKNKKKASEILEDETKEMEAQLEQLKKYMDLERERKTTENFTKDGSRWKTGNKSTAIKGYGQQVLDHHKKELQRTKKRVLKNNAAGVLTNKENIKVQSSSGAPKPPKDDPQKVDSSSYPEVYEFLSAINLTKYVSTFVENGFEDLDTILELNEEYLETLGIPLGHKLKIVKRIKELKPDENPTKPDLQAQIEPEVLTDHNTGVSMGTDIMAEETQVHTSEAHSSSNRDLYSHNNESIGMSTDPMDNEYPDMCGVEVSTSNPTTGKQMSNAQTQDNEEEEKVFMDPPPHAKLPKSVKFNDIKDIVPAQPKAEPKEPKKMVTTEMSTDPMLSGCKIGAKESCWQCYKLEVISDMMSITEVPNKLFCSQK